eukprot:COSAG01_NODE_2025_length_8604_cov_16.296296_11_plen_112_part_00
MGTLMLVSHIFITFTWLILGCHTPLVGLLLRGVSSERVCRRVKHGGQPGYDTYLSRCHSPCKSINRSPMFGCNGSCYVFVLVYMSYSVLFLYIVLINHAAGTLYTGSHPLY